MKIEDIVCSLDLARELKELGVNNVSFFYHTLGRVIYISETPFFFDRIYPAYTSDELDRMLPVNKICKMENDKNEEILLTFSGWFRKSDSCFKINADNETTNCIYNIYEDTTNDSLCNILAKALIHLIKNGYVKAEELKL
jgi:hypothetical protein